MLENIKPIYLHCVFHGIRFKVSNLRLVICEDGHFFAPLCPVRPFTAIIQFFSNNNDYAVKEWL